MFKINGVLFSGEKKIENNRIPRIRNGSTATQGKLVILYTRKHFLSIHFDNSFFDNKSVMKQ